MAQNGISTSRAVPTRRRLLGWGAVAGAAVMAPVPLRYALATSKPYKIGSIQPLTGVAASGGKTALVGVQMAVERINASGGILGREVELIAADDESKPDIGRRQTEKLLVEDEVDAHVVAFCPTSVSPACRSTSSTRSST